MTCPSCGTIAAGGVQRCSRCGGSLEIPTLHDAPAIPVVRAPTNRGEAAQRAAGIVAVSLVPPKPAGAATPVPVYQPPAPQPPAAPPAPDRGPAPYSPPAGAYPQQSYAPPAPPAPSRPPALSGPVAPPPPPAAPYPGQQGPQPAPPAASAASWPPPAQTVPVTPPPAASQSVAPARPAPRPEAPGWVHQPPPPQPDAPSYATQRQAQTPYAPTTSVPAVSDPPTEAYPVADATRADVPRDEAEATRHGGRPVEASWPPPPGPWRNSRPASES